MTLPQHHVQGLGQPVIVDSNVFNTGLSQDQLIGLILALSSSAFIGSSFIVKKKGLRRAAATGIRAGAGGFGYLSEPLWWAGFLTMAIGEAANFAAYAFAPAILVTPLGALSIIFSAVLAHYLLSEKLNVFGVLGCVLCIVGSTTIVVNAPAEREVESVQEVFNLAASPGFTLYTLVAMVVVFYLIFNASPKYGSSNILVYVGICSVVGSFSVVSCKALGIAIKLTLKGNSQLSFPETYFFGGTLVICLVTQMNYLNKSLDLFNTAVVSPVYYVMFTVSTIAASMIMFKIEQPILHIITELCGFITIVIGTFILHVTKDLEAGAVSQTLADLTRPRGGGTSAPPAPAGGEEAYPLAARERDRDKEREREREREQEMEKRFSDPTGQGLLAGSKGEDWEREHLRERSQGGGMVAGGAPGAAGGVGAQSTSNTAGSNSMAMTQARERARRGEPGAEGGGQGTAGLTGVEVHSIPLSAVGGPGAQGQGGGKGQGQAAPRRGFWW